MNNARLTKAVLERYNDLVSDSPDLLKRVKLFHVASHLVIAMESLSRIRGK